MSEERSKLRRIALSMPPLQPGDSVSVNVNIDPLRNDLDVPLQPLAIEYRLVYERGDASERMPRTIDQRDLRDGRGITSRPGLAGA